MRERQWRIALIAVLSLAAAFALVAGPPLANGQSDGPGEIWAEAVNISKSGSASLPVLAAVPNGTLYALWWDKFDGTKVARYTPKDGWSEPQDSPQVTGGRTLIGTKNVRTPPLGLRLLASSSGWIHAFWLDSKNNLRYARARSKTGIFALGPALATNPLKWDVSLDADDVLHLAFVRADNTEAMPSGVYYRTSRNDGGSWQSPAELVTSLYFRAQPANEAFVRVASDGKGLVLAAWDDAELQRSYYTWSNDGGQTFEPAIEVQSMQESYARRTRLFPVTNPGGEFLRLWNAGDACALYQQSSADQGLSWGNPRRVLDTLSDCPERETSYPLSDSRLLAVFRMDSARSFLSTWDGSRWSVPLGLQISFVDTFLNRPITLGCVDAALAGEQLAVIGCDQFGDVWATTSQLQVPALLPALTTAWTPPITMALEQGDAGLPSAAVDGEGRLYAMWSQSTEVGQPGTQLMQVTSDGVNWPEAASVLRSSAGKAELPALVAAPDGVLHVVWSGGFAGHILYSRAFIRDARTASGWSAPQELPSPRPVGGWPDLAVDSAGTLHAAFTVPLNENRGVYYTRSQDGGITWSAPQLVFDAAAAGWSMVRSSRLAVDGSGRLHLVWVKAALPGAGAPLAVFYSRSEDQGHAWTEPVQVAGIDSDNPRLIAAAPDEIHIIWAHSTSAGWEINHQWSPDGGQTWSSGALIQGLRQVSTPDFGLATDGRGTVYLVGIERSRQNSAALFYVRWNGRGWVDRESVPLGYDPADGSGATAVLRPTGQLGVFYRILAPQENGSARYVVGYVSRPIAVGQLTPVPTFTAGVVLSQPTQPDTGVALTPLPTPNVPNVAPPTVDNTVRIQIGVALAVILLVSALALVRLLGGRR